MISLRSNSSFLIWFGVCLSIIFLPDSNSISLLFLSFKNADFVYTKNWSSYEDYGKVINTDSNWMITNAKIGHAKFMHCLPVRRNVIVADEVIDSRNSIVIEQANNRTYAAQIVLKKILESL